jgi:hypothetical protein
MQPVSPTVTALQPKRRGPKPKKIADRKPLEEVRVVKRDIKQYSRRKKLEVLVFLHHHRIQCEDGSFRSPTQKEAASIFKIPQQTISNWVRNEQRIVEGKAGSKRTRDVSLELFLAGDKPC